MRSSPCTSPRSLALPGRVAAATRAANLPGQAPLPGGEAPGAGGRGSALAPAVFRPPSPLARWRSSAFSVAYAVCDAWAWGCFFLAAPMSPRRPRRFVSGAAPRRSQVSKRAPRTRICGGGRSSAARWRPASAAPCRRLDGRRRGRSPPERTPQERASAPRVPPSGGGRPWRVVEGGPAVGIGEPALRPKVVSLVVGADLIPPHGFGSAAGGRAEGGGGGGGGLTALTGGSHLVPSIFNKL
jgi:hypothetical protein